MFIPALLIIAKPEIIQMFINRRMDNKAWYVYPYNGIVLRNKKRQTTQMCNNMDEFQKHYDE